MMRIITRIPKKIIFYCAESGNMSGIERYGFYKFTVYDNAAKNLLINELQNRSVCLDYPDFRGYGRNLYLVKEDKLEDYTNNTIKGTFCGIYAMTFEYDVYDFRDFNEEFDNPKDALEYCNVDLD